MGFPSKNTGVGCHFLLQGIFLTQFLNLGLLYRRSPALPVDFVPTGPPAKPENELNPSVYFLTHTMCVYVCACALGHFSHVWLSVTPWTVHGILQAEHWSGLPCPPPGDLLNPGIEPLSLMAPALAGGFFTTRTTWKAQGVVVLLFKLFYCLTPGLTHTWEVIPTSFCPLSAQGNPSYLSRALELQLRAWAQETQMQREGILHVPFNNHTSLQSLIRTTFVWCILIGIPWKEQQH